MNEIMMIIKSVFNDIKNCEQLNLGEIIDKIFDKVNFLGVDFGDGEYAAFRVTGYDNENKQLTTTVLTFVKEFVVTHFPNVIYFEDGKAKLTRNGEPGRENYSNFKKLPGDNGNASEQYDPDKENSPTYAELMSHSFAAALELLASCNKLSFDKTTIVIVGRPSSKGWEDAEKAYIETLSSKLSDYLGEYYENIHLFAISESRAALTGERVGILNNIIQILDLGSSTIDSSIVKDNAIIPESDVSFEFGGNALDMMFEAHAVHCLRNEKDSRASAVPQYNRQLWLRVNKEEFYAKERNETQNIEDIVFQAYPLKYRLGNEISQDRYYYSINAQVAYAVHDNADNIEELKCKVIRRTDNEAGNEKESDSWLAGMEYVLTQIYEFSCKYYRQDDKVNRKLDRLILTGGVSNMQCVRGVAESVFHIEPEFAKEPSLSVAKGLAVTLGNEVVKEYMRRKILNEVSSSKKYDFIEKTEKMRDEAVSSACIYTLDMFEKGISNWAELDGNCSLKMLFDCIKGQPWDKDIDSVFNEALRTLYNGIKTDLQKTMRDNFESLFPGYQGNTDFIDELPELKDVCEFPNIPGYKNSIGFYFGEGIQAKELETNNTEAIVNAKYSKEERIEILNLFERRQNYLVDQCKIQIANNGKEVTGFKGYYEEIFTKECAESFAKAANENLQIALDQYINGITDLLAMRPDEA